MKTPWKKDFDDMKRFCRKMNIHVDEVTLKLACKGDEWALTKIPPAIRDLLRIPRGQKGKWR